VTFRCAGIKVHVEIADPMPEALDSVDGSIWDGKLTLSRNGLAIAVPALGITWDSKTGGTAFAEGFDVFCSSIFGSASHAPQYSLAGSLAVRAIKWMERWRPMPRVGGPKRGRRWNAPKESFFALVQSTIESGTDVTNAIRAVAASNPKLLRKAFGDKSGSVSSVRRLYYRWKEELNAAPPDAITVSRIKGIRFEFEDGP
jgi:hypothetical protein